MSDTSPSTSTARHARAIERRLRGHIRDVARRDGSRLALEPPIARDAAQAAIAGEQRAGIRALSERLLAAMRYAAYPDGWVVAVHGSMERDLDVIGVPWSSTATAATAFVEAMRAAVARELAGDAWIRDAAGECPAIKANGRRSWLILAQADALVQIGGQGRPYIDLSVIDGRLLAADAAR